MGSVGLPSLRPEFNPAFQEQFTLYEIDSGSSPVDEDWRQAIALAEKIQLFAVEKGIFSGLQINQKVNLLLDGEYRSYGFSSYPEKNQIIVGIKSSHPHVFNLSLRVYSLIFERLNVLREKEFTQLDEQVKLFRMGVNEYVESVEKVEHENALRVQEMIKCAVDSGMGFNLVYYPDLIIEDFYTHYQFQQFYGHSEGIVRKYLSLRCADKCRYKRTFALFAEDMKQEQVEMVDFLFRCKIALERGVLSQNDLVSLIEHNVRDPKRSFIVKAMKDLKLPFSNDLIYTRSSSPAPKRTELKAPAIELLFGG